MIDAVREQVRNLRAQFGEPIEVRIKKSGDIDVCFKNGATITLGPGYKYGYQGTGPLLFFSFLKEAGFKVSQKQVEQMKAPFVLTREPKEGGTRRTRQEWKSGSVKIEAFDEAEAKKAAQGRIPDKASITGIKIIQKGTKGLLGIGRKPHVYQIRYKLPQKLEKDETKPRQSSSNRNEDACLAFFVFDSDTISNEVSAYYGLYAQEDILKTISKSIKKTGGWDACSCPIQGCHGDLFEKHPLGKQFQTVKVLGQWLKNKIYDIDSSSLDIEMANKIKRGQKLGYIPYVVGLGPIKKLHVLDADKELRTIGTVGYLGLFTLPASVNLSEIAHKLYLPMEMEIKGSECKGWRATKKVLKEVGLKLQ